MASHTHLTPVHLAAVIYTSSKVFDGLHTDRINTEEFLRSGDLAGIASRANLAILKDLRDVTQFVIDTRAAGSDGDAGARPIDADYVCAVNTHITHSGACTQDSSGRPSRTSGSAPSTADTSHRR